MPTGYTSKVYEGENVSAEDFILTCARAFGAYIEFREESLSKAAPDKFEPNKHYLNQLEKAKSKLEALKTISQEEVLETIEKNYIETLKRNKERYEEKLALKHRYETLLEEVRKWIPPTPEHVNLKEFCIKQLEESIEFDCSYVNRYSEEVVTKETPEEWLKTEEEFIQRDISYFEKQWNEEVKRIDERNHWIKELKESFAK